MALLESLPLSVYVIDSSYHVVMVNKPRAIRSGIDQNELLGQKCHRALYDLESPCPGCKAGESLLNSTATQRIDRRQVGADEVIEWEINTYPVFESGEAPEVLFGDQRPKYSSAAKYSSAVILVEQNTSERRHLELILAQSEKLAAIGQLAAGVAHEINNPLTAIIANAQILSRELPADSDLQESVELINRAGARAAQVVRNLLDFARKEEYSLGLTDLNETVERALELVRHELVSRGANLQYIPDPHLPLILASQDLLQSVWLNLLLNAMDSLDKEQGEVRITTRQAGSEIQVSVADNGKGIPPEYLQRIFEPFYTTKAPGRGTGLGLSVSNRIVKQHGGSIRVNSQVGAGSEFIVILPVA